MTTALLQEILNRSLREDGPRLLAGLIRLAGDIDLAEDALQEAAARALAVWPVQGTPERPGAWLNTVARRLVLDAHRQRRPSAEFELVSIDAEPEAVEDDLLRLLFVCCHPAISTEASVPLALRLLCGLSTPEIARAFLISESAAAQRIVRAKHKIRAAGIAFELPRADLLDVRLDGVLAVIYLLFNEGYAATEAVGLTRPDLCREAIRLARLAVELLSGRAEPMGLLALLLLTEARRSARQDAKGNLVQLEQQDRRRWDRALIKEGITLLDRALALRAPGAYQIEAAIAALHGEARTPESTDWPQIRLLYRRLLALRPSPVVALNAAVAEAMVRGPQVGLAWIERIEAGGGPIPPHLLHAARAELLSRLGRRDAAADSFRLALAKAGNGVERRFLEQRLTECCGSD